MFSSLVVKEKKINSFRTSYATTHDTKRCLSKFGGEHVVLLREPSGLHFLGYERNWSCILKNNDN